MTITEKNIPKSIWKLMNSECEKLIGSRQGNLLGRRHLLTKPRRAVGPIYPHRARRRPERVRVRRVFCFFEGSLGLEFHFVFCFPLFSSPLFCLIFSDPSARPQTRDLFKIAGKKVIAWIRKPGSGSQDVATRIW